MGVHYSFLRILPMQSCKQNEDCVMQPYVWQWYILRLYLRAFQAGGAGLSTIKEVHTQFVQLTECLQDLLQWFGPNDQHGLTVGSQQLPPKGQDPANSANKTLNSLYDCLLSSVTLYYLKTTILCHIDWRGIRGSCWRAMRSEGADNNSFAQGVAGVPEPAREGFGFRLCSHLRRPAWWSAWMWDIQISCNRLITSSALLPYLRRSCP